MANLCHLPSLYVHFETDPSCSVAGLGHIPSFDIYLEPMLRDWLAILGHLPPFTYMSKKIFYQVKYI